MMLRWRRRLRVRRPDVRNTPIPRAERALDEGRRVKAEIERRVRRLEATAAAARDANEAERRRA